MRVGARFWTGRQKNQSRHTHKKTSKLCSVQVAEWVERADDDRQPPGSNPELRQMCWFFQDVTIWYGFVTISIHAEWTGLGSLQSWRVWMSRDPKSEHKETTGLRGGGGWEKQSPPTSLPGGDLALRSLKYHFPDCSESIRHHITKWESSDVSDKHFY